MSEIMNGEQAVLDAFAEYWRANYGDGCVISSREWHLPKLQRAIRHALRPVLTAAQAELAAVREVEAWIQRGNDPLLPQHYVAGLVGERLGAFAGLDTADVIARSIPELGRALAAQETAQLFNCPTHFAGADPGCPACRAKQPPATEAHG